MTTILCYSFENVILRHTEALKLERLPEGFNTDTLPTIQNAKTQENYNTGILQLEAQNTEFFWDMLKEISPSNSDMLADYLSAMVQEENQVVAISTNLPFRNLIKRYLNEIVGLSDDVLSKILFVHNEESLTLEYGEKQFKELAQKKHCEQHPDSKNSSVRYISSTATLNGLIRGHFDQIQLSSSIASNEPPAEPLADSASSTVSSSFEPSLISSSDASLAASFSLDVTPPFESLSATPVDLSASAEEEVIVPDSVDKELLCFDFDLTITSEHIFRLMTSDLDEMAPPHPTQFSDEKSWNEALHAWSMTNEEALWDKVKHVEPLGGKENWQRIFSELAKTHHLSIVTFNPFKNIVERYLREKVGLSKEIIDQINIIAWLPFNEATHRKNQHIEQAIEHVHPGRVAHFPKDKCVLIDDSRQNIVRATGAGYESISATKTAHVDYILREMCPPLVNIARPVAVPAPAPAAAAAAARPLTVLPEPVITDASLALLKQTFLQGIQNYRNAHQPQSGCRFELFDALLHSEKGSARADRMETAVKTASNSEQLIDALKTFFTTDTGPWRKTSLNTMLFNHWRNNDSFFSGSKCSSDKAAVALLDNFQSDINGAFYSIPASPATKTIGR